MSQAEFFRQEARKSRVRPSARTLCFRGAELLAQRPVEEPDAPFSFPGGEIRPGELMEDTVRREYSEELGVTVHRLEYLFVVENRFRVDDGLFHGLEHYFRVDLADQNVRTREGHIEFHWLALSRLPTIDLRPAVVRAAIIDGAWRQVHHLVVPLPEG